MLGGASVLGAGARYQNTNSTTPNIGFRVVLRSKLYIYSSLVSITNIAGFLYINDNKAYILTYNRASKYTYLSLQFITNSSENPCFAGLGIHPAWDWTCVTSYAVRGVRTKGTGRLLGG